MIQTVCEVGKCVVKWRLQAGWLFGSLRLKSASVRGVTTSHAACTGTAAAASPVLLARGLGGSYPIGYAQRGFRCHRLFA